MGGFHQTQTHLKSHQTDNQIQNAVIQCSMHCASVLLYGCESWVLTETLLKKLYVYARTCYRIMLGIRESDIHMRNEELYKKCAQHPIRELVRERQLKFIGHCLRMDKEEYTNIYAQVGGWAKPSW